MTLEYLLYLQGVTATEISERGTSSTSSRKSKRFTAAHVAFLTENSGKYTAKEFAKALGFAAGSIRRKMQSLGLQCKGSPSRS